MSAVDWNSIVKDFTDVTQVGGDLRSYVVSALVSKLIDIYDVRLGTLEEKINSLVFGYLEDGKSALESAQDSNKTVKEKQTELKRAFIEFERAYNRLKSVKDFRTSAFDAAMAAAHCAYLAENKSGAERYFKNAISIMSSVLEDLERAERNNETAKGVTDFAKLAGGVALLMSFNPIGFLVFWGPNPITVVNLFSDAEGIQQACQEKKIAAQSELKALQDAKK